jgi:hypothetical protein
MRFGSVCALKGGDSPEVMPRLPLSAPEAIGVEALEFMLELGVAPFAEQLIREVAYAVRLVSPKKSRHSLLRSNGSGAQLRTTAPPRSLRHPS